MNNSTQNPQRISKEQIDLKPTSKIQLSQVSQIQQQPQVRQSTMIIKSSQITRILKIINKSAQMRNSKDIKQLNDYVLQHPLFSVLNEKVSINLVKALLSKCKDMIHLPQDTIISKEGDKIEHVTLLLFGKMVNWRRNKSSQFYESQEDLYQKLGLVANSEVKEINRLLRRNKSTSQEENINKSKQVSYKKLQKTESLIKDTTQCFESGIKDLVFSRKYLKTTVLKQQSWILRIPIKQFFILYNQVIQKKIQVLSSKFCSIPCFNELSKQVLQTLILSLCCRKHNRGFKIYNQKDQAHNIYFLTQGSVKLVKNSRLFEQNPNQLYGNRLQIMLQNQLQNSKSKKPRPRYEIRQMQAKRASATLPYANLTSMFNYQPKNKNIQIGVISEFCVFGEQELLYKKHQKFRQTSVICDTFSVQFYEISFNKLLDIIGKQSNTFTKRFKQYCANKIIRRQDHYANSINFQNSFNLNYFYDSDRIEGSSHKFRISKVNNKLMDHRNTIDVIDRNSKSHQLVKKNIYDHKIETNPMYTAFNFHKLKQRSRILLPEMKQDQNLKQSINLNNNSLKKSIYLNRDKSIEKVIQRQKQMIEQDEDQEYDVNDRPSKEQMKIFGISHTWKLVKKRVNEQQYKSTKISPNKHYIGIDQPLIANQFLKNSDIQSRKVERMIRKDKITLTSKKNRSNQSLRKAQRALIQYKNK